MSDDLTGQLGKLDEALKANGGQGLAATLGEMLTQFSGVSREAITKALQQQQKSETKSEPEKPHASASSSHSGGAAKR